MFKIYQGETAYINITVLTEAGAAANLNGATAKFACAKGTELLNKPCTIVNNIVTVKLLPIDTDTMIGKYTFEIKIQDVSLDIDTIVVDYIQVEKSIMPTY